mgnify:CR=1 FL=1
MKTNCKHSYFLLASASTSLDLDIILVVLQILFKLLKYLEGLVVYYFFSLILVQIPE